ncbi:MAG: CHAT domain-containing tetratricopeptide repeat protein [Burkholderiaceae bacterium]
MLIKCRHKFLFFALYLCSLGSLGLSHAQAQTVIQNDTEVNLEKIKVPPRDIKDILRVLQQSKPNVAEMDKVKAIIATPVPVTTDKEVLNTFYYKRAKAYESIGKMDQALADTMLTTQKYPARDPRMELEDIIREGFLEMMGGKNTNAIKAFERAKNYQTRNLPQLIGYQLSLERVLTTSHAAAGNFEASKKALNNMESTLFILRRSSNYENQGPFWESNLLSARGIYFSSQGQWIESEKAFRSAIRFLEKGYEKVKTSASKVDALDDGPRLFANASNDPRIYNINIIHRELDLAYALLQQRRLTDAEYFARKALQQSLDSFGSGSVNVGDSLIMLARIVNEQGRHAESVLLAQAAKKSATDGGAPNDSIVMAQARRALGTALVADSKYAAANTAFEEMQAGIQGDPELAKTFLAGDLDWVLAMLKTNKANQAELMASQMLSRLEKSADKNSPRLAMIRAFEASALQAQGKWQEASSAYKQSIPVLIDQARNDAENDTSSVKQQQRMTYLLESYLAVLAKTAQSEPAQAAAAAAESFTIADLARGSGVQRALTASAARANIKDPQLAGLARNEQDLQRRINTLSELLTGLLSASPDQQLPAVQAKIRSDIATFKTDREKIKKEIEKKFPDYAELVEPKPASIERTQKLLRGDEVLVSWYFGDQAGYVWSISKQGPAQFIQIPLSRGQMAKQVAQLRKSLDPGVSTIDEIPPFDIAAAHQLYQQILEPVAASLQGKKVLLVVPHAGLGQLPLSVLVTKASAQPAKTGIAFAGYKSTPWLARDIAIAQIPSVTALTALRNLPEGDANRKSFVGFGDPYFSAEQQKSADKAMKPTQLATRGVPLKLRNAPKTAGVSSAELALLPRLPDTSDEIQDIAKAVGATSGDIYLHKQASVKQVMGMDLSDRKVVMFSTHGLVPGELNGLTQPALALSSPEVTGDTDDGLLTMDMVLTLKLNADWVVLSACNTASGEGAGSEAVSGLGRAFFFAGAKALLVSNWPVDSAASRGLMTDLFKRQQSDKTLAKSEALRQAMLGQIDQGGMGEGKAMKYSYAHPLFWAPFVVVGD